MSSALASTPPLKPQWTARALCVAALLCAGAPLAQASNTIYTDANAFLGAVGPVSTEDFEGQPGRSLRSQVFHLSDLTVSSGSPIGLQTGPTSPGNGNGAFGTAGPSYVLVFDNINRLDPSVYLSFDRPITSIGFDITDLGDLPGVLRLTTDVGAFSVGADVFSSSGFVDSSTPLFFGLQQDLAFTTLNVHFVDDSGLGESFGLDNVRFVGAVPEPASALMMLGGAALMLLRRRRG